MNVPNLPNPSVVLTESTGHMSDHWYKFFTQLTTQLQQNISQEGLGVPQQSTSNISILQAATPKPSIVYNSDTHEPLISVNGIYKVIQTS